MSPVVTLLLPVLIAGMASGMTVRELRLFREAREAPSNLFPYSLGRLFRRLGGILLLLVVAATLALIGLTPPATSKAAVRFVLALMGEVTLLFGLSVWDLWESSRMPRPRLPSPRRTPFVRPPGTPLH